MYLENPKELIYKQFKQAYELRRNTRHEASTQKPAVFLWTELLPL